MRMVVDPMRGRDQAVREKRNVEPVASVQIVLRFLRSAQKIEQHGSQSGLVKFRGDELVAFAVTAASAAVREKNDARGVRRHHPHRLEFRGIHGNANDSRESVFRLMPAGLFFGEYFDHGELSFVFFGEERRTAPIRAPIERPPPHPRHGVIPPRQSEKIRGPVKTSQKTLRANARRSSYENLFARLAQW